MDWRLFSETCGRKQNIGGAFNLGVKVSREIVAGIDWSGPALDALADGARGYLAAVLPEIRELDRARSLNWQRLARRAVVFGLASPRRDVEQAMDIARWVEPQWERLADCRRWKDDDGIWQTEGDAVELLRRYPNRAGRTIGCTNYKDLAWYLHSSIDLLREPRPDGFTPQALAGRVGIGPKVARMICAVANPHGRWFTIDLWHGRQLLALAGKDYAVQPSIAAAAYPILEEPLLEWAERTLPGVPAWAAQWAVWDAAFGQHKSHRHIWEDLIAA